MRLNPGHRREHLPEYPVENLALVQNRVLDRNLVLRHHQSLDLLLVHVLNRSPLLDRVANHDQDLVLLSLGTLLNQDLDQNHLRDLVLDLQPNLDLDLHRVRNLDQSRDPFHDQDQLVAVEVNLVVAVVKVVLKVNK